MQHQSHLIVVVDDDAFVRESFRKIVTKLGFSYQAFCSAEESMADLEQRFLQGNLPSLVLLDYHLPGLSGAEMLKALRKSPKFEDLSVVFFSGSQDKEMVRAATELRARDILLKPVQPDLIRKRLGCFMKDLEISEVRDLLARCSSQSKPELLEGNGFRRFRKKGYEVYPVSSGNEEYLILADKSFRPDLLSKLDEQTLRLVMSLFLRTSAWAPLWPRPGAHRLNLAGAGEGQTSPADPELSELLDSLLP